MADYTRFKLRGDVKADWLNANPVLALNEPALETDTKRFKIGDGVSTYSALPYGRNTGEYSGFYNVSALFPLASGFYTHETAIAAIQTAERIKGLIISYETAAGIWYTEQYIGSDVSGWATLTNWSKVPGASDFTEMEEELAQLRSELNTSVDNAMKCVILTEEEYFSLEEFDSKTMYVITGLNDQGVLEITSAYLGELKFATGTSSVDPNEIPIQTLELSEYDVTIEKSAATLITASWQPENATSTILSWLSSNTLVATVNSGNITGVNKGSCIITVKARSGVKATVNVTVTVTLLSLELQSKFTSLVPSYSSIITAVPTPIDADIDLTWTSSDPNALSITESATDTKKSTALASVIGSGVLTVTGAATADGHVFVKPNEIYEIEVAAGDTAIQVADKIRSATYTGWTTGGAVGTNIVTFTKTSTGLCYRPSLTDAVTASEVDVLTIKTILTTSGNITVTLNGVDTIIALSTTTHTTRPLVATAIAAGTYAGFTAVASSNTVVFTSTTTGRKVYPVFAAGTTGCTATFKRTTRGDTATGVTGTFITNDPSSVTITATDVKGVHKSLGFTIEPYTIYVDSSTLDDTDNSTTSIFTNWQIERTGTVSLYKFKETYLLNGAPIILQETDYIAIPESNVVQIELWAEFGNKTITWSFMDAGGKETTVIWNILYKEPELVSYSFDIDVVCTSTEAAALTMTIPFYKYNKGFAYALRNDDGRPSLWRQGFRYVNRERDYKIINYTGATIPYLASLSEDNVLRSPRRLGYTDGTGIIKTYCFDTAGNVTLGSGTESNPYTVIWDIEVDGDRIDIHDTLKAKDYGGHYMLHNIIVLPTDQVQPQFENDFAYAMQRDRQIIYDRFNYTSISFANPDGDWWYTRPCIKDPKTLFLSGGGTYADIDPNDIYGRPSFRQLYYAMSNLYTLPLSEIRNTLLMSYVFNNNNPYIGNLWKTQKANASPTNYTFVSELVHHIGDTNTESHSVGWNGNRAFFNEIYDTVGANGDDSIWFCSNDEIIEYLYYKRVANVTKTITETGCKFNIAFDIPDYLSYKTYSAIINNLPTTAVLTMTSTEILTYYSKNLNTGLINWGVSSDITERASRYVAEYLTAPTNDKLDQAWYFVRQLGELGNTLSTQLPPFNELPIISNITYNATPTDSSIVITTINSNKEFGEADALEVSTNSDFTAYSIYIIAYADHKYYSSIDNTCLTNDWPINISADFSTPVIYYTRLRNFYGHSNIYPITITLTRESGVNDPTMTWTLPSKFTSDTEVTFSISHSYISSMRYKVTDTYSDWITPTASITLSLVKDTVYSIVIQGKNNLDEVVEQTLEFTFSGKQRTVLFANAYAGNVTDVGYVNDGIAYNNTYTEDKSILDLDGNHMFYEQAINIAKWPTNLGLLRTKWGITGEVYLNTGYWPIPNLISGISGDYPDSLIINSIKRVNVYGGINADSTYQTVKYFKNVPIGTYNVRLLVTTSAIGSTNATYPVCLRVNDTIQTITDTTVFFNNNNTWHVFNDITVGADGYMLISEYSNVTLPYATTAIPPIVLIEITKVS